MAKLSANSGDTDQTPYSVASLGLHCLPVTLLRVSQLQGDKEVLVNFLPMTFFCNKAVS